MVPSKWVSIKYVVVTKWDHASNSVPGLGCGVRVAQAVNNPEIGSASKPKRTQLVAGVGGDEDNINQNTFPIPSGHELKVYL